MSTWGPTNLAANADDGTDAGGWNISGFGDKNYFDDATYPAWSFAMPAIAAGSTISKMYLSTYYATAGDGTCEIVLRIEDVDPASQTVWGSGHLPSSATPINTDMAATAVDTTSHDRWLFGEGQGNASNLASSLQDIVDAYGAITAGQRINIWGIRTSTGSQFLGVADYNAGSNRPTLYIEWTEGGGPAGGGGMATLHYYYSRRRN